MPVLRKCLVLTASAALVLLAFVSDTSASMTVVQANISFERTIDVHKQSDVSFGTLQVRPNDKVSMSADGNVRLSGKGEILSPFGHPSVIQLGDTRDHVMNFIPGNYMPGAGITALHAHCAIQDGDCNLPVFGKKENTLFIGMDMTIGDTADNSRQPSFDMSVVYQ